MSRGMGMRARAAILLSLGRTPVLGDYVSQKVDSRCADPCFVRGQFQVMKPQPSKKGS